MSYSLLFLKLVSSKEFIFVLQRDEPEDWTSSLWTNTLELHQLDFRATNVIDWEECFANKTVETYMLLSLICYSLNIYLNYINKLLMTKMVRRIYVWFIHLLKNGCCSQFFFLYIHMRIIVIVIIAISWSDHNSQ